MSQWAIPIRCTPPKEDMEIKTKTKTKTKQNKTKNPHFHQEYPPKINHAFGHNDKKDMEIKKQTNKNKNKTKTKQRNKTRKMKIPKSFTIFGLKKSEK